MSREASTPSSTLPRWARVGAWIIIPLAGTLWAASGLRGLWFFYDEWSMIDRVMHTDAATGMLMSFNGHLWMFQYLVYGAQVSWFGIGHHWFIDAVLLLSLLSLQLAIATLLRITSVPVVTALVAAGLLTYLGVAAQNMLFGVELSPDLAIALCVWAAAVAIRFRPGWFSCAAVGTLLLAAVGVDSGAALAMAAFGAIVTVLTWRNWSALVVTPSLIALGAWYAFAPLGPSWPGSLGVRAAFTVHLFLQAFGGLVGGGQTQGIVLSVFAAAFLWLGIQRGILAGAIRTLFIAGAVAVVVTVGAVAQSRAALVGSDFIDFNRYLTDVDVPLVLALAPLIAGSVRSVVTGIFPKGMPNPSAQVVRMLPPTLLVAAFLLGLGSFTSYAQSFKSWNLNVHESANSAATVIAAGCPPGRSLDLASQPAGSLSPQMTTQLIGDLMARGEFVPPRGWTVPPQVVAVMCKPSAASHSSG